MVDPQKAKKVFEFEAELEILQNEREGAAIFKHCVSNCDSIKIGFIDDELLHQYTQAGRSFNAVEEVQELADEAKSLLVIK